MECIDPVCEAFSFLPPPLRVIVMAIICSAPLWSIFFIVPIWRKKKGPSSRQLRRSTLKVAAGTTEPTLREVEATEERPGKLLDERHDDDDDNEPDSEVPELTRVRPLQQTAVGSLEFYEFVQMWLSSRDENPHLMLDGNTGAGKTITAEAIGQACIANGDRLLVINPGHKEGQWDNHVISVDDDGDISLMEATFKWLVWEVKRRGAVMKSEGVSNLQPLVIVWDELPETMEDIKSAAEFLRRVLRRGRAIKMYVIGIVQLSTGSEMNLKGRTGLKRGFRVMYLGNTARLKAPELLDEDDPYPAVLEWNGALYTVDRSELLDSANEPFPEDAFVTPDFTKVADVDTVRWTEKHVQAAAFILKNSGASLTAVTRHLFPKSNGRGPYRDRVKAILAEVQAALTSGQRRAVVEEFDDDFDDEEDVGRDDAGHAESVGASADR